MRSLTRERGIKRRLGLRRSTAPVANRAAFAPLAGPPSAAERGIAMSETQETARLSSERLLESGDAEATSGRSENVIAFGAVALVSLVVGFLLGLLF